MKIVVIGGTGLIGARLVERLQQHGHAALAASPGTGVNTLTRQGLAQAMDAADVVVDVSNSPQWDDQAVLDFFQTSTRHLLAAAAAAGVRHFVALSIVGTERNPDNGYFRAKLAQEALIQASSVPYTLLRATQFFEFVGGIAESSVVGNEIRLSPALFQPVAADDVVSALADIALGAPLQGTRELAGPQALPLDEAARRLLRARQDPRAVVADVHARYYGAELDDRSLTPGADARLGAIHYDDWLAQAIARAGL